MHVTGVQEASTLLRQMSEPWGAGETLKSAITRVAEAVNNTGLSYRILREPIKVSRIEDIWTCEARRIDSEEMDAIRAARKVTKIASLPSQLTALEETFALVDPQYFGPVMQALRKAARAAGGQADDTDAAPRPLAKGRR